MWSSEAERPNCESGIEEGRVDGIEAHKAHITWSTGWVLYGGAIAWFGLWEIGIQLLFCSGGEKLNYVR